MKFPFGLRKSAEFDAVGFGTNAVDYLIQVPTYPEFGAKVELSEWQQMAGGEVASTMAGLGRLGFRTAYIGRFGSDIAGELGRSSLKNEGVDISMSETVSNAETQVAFILIDETSGERTIAWKRDKRLAYTTSDAPVKGAAKGRILHMTPHDAAACLLMAKAAKTEKAIVSIDIDSVFDGVTELLPTIDVMIASAEFPERLLGIRDIRAGLKEIAARYGCAISGATQGVNGSIIYCNGEFIETPAFSPPGGCRDTTGAGDAFRTGFLYGLLSGESVETSAIFANGVAALKCRSLGARDGLPDKHGLNMFTKNMDS